MLMRSMLVTARFQDVNRSPFKHTTQTNLIKQAFTLYYVPLLISLDAEQVSRYYLSLRANGYTRVLGNSGQIDPFRP